MSRAASALRPDSCSNTPSSTLPPPLLQQKPTHMWRLAATSHVAELVMPLTILTYPFAHDMPFSLVLRLTLRLMRSPHSTLSFSQWHCLPSRASCRLRTHPSLRSSTSSSWPTCRPHLALPIFVSVLPGPGEVRLMAVPHLTTLDASPGLVVALVAGRPVGRVTLHVARILYDGLHSGCGFPCARE